MNISVNLVTVLIEKLYIHIYGDYIRFNEVLIRRYHTVSFNALGYPKESNLS